MWKICCCKKCKKIWLGVSFSKHSPNLRLLNKYGQYAVADPMGQVIRIKNLVRKNVSFNVANFNILQFTVYYNEFYARLTYHRRITHQVHLSMSYLVLEYPSLAKFVARAHQDLLVAFEKLFFLESPKKKEVKWSEVRQSLRKIQLSYSIEWSRGQTKAASTTGNTHFRSFFASFLYGIPHRSDVLRTQIFSYLNSNFFLSWHIFLPCRKLSHMK